MISYELAKELKYAGFPVRSYRPAADILVGGFVEPTLSELIEACGRKFRELKTTDTKWWYATAGDYLKNSSILGAREFSQGGATLEEAVAKLWLVLNRK